MCVQKVFSVLSFIWIRKGYFAKIRAAPAFSEQGRLSQYNWSIWFQNCTWRRCSEFTYLSIFLWEDWGECNWHLSLRTSLSYVTPSWSVLAWWLLCVSVFCRHIRVRWSLSSVGWSCLVAHTQRHKCSRERGWGLWAGMQKRTRKHWAAGGGQWMRGCREWMSGEFKATAVPSLSSLLQFLPFQSRRNTTC